jgi:DNA gyrase subunit A
VGDDDEVMLISDQGKIIRMKIADLRVIGRNTQGVTLIGLDGERAPGGRGQLG